MGLGRGAGRGISILAKILLISDMHILSVAVGSQKGQAIKLYQKIFEKIIDLWKMWNVAIAVPRLWSAISERGIYKKILVNGDAIEAEYNERGMLHVSDICQIRSLKKRLQFFAETIFVPGDHELGYRLPLSSDSQGGLSETSIRHFEVECNRVVGRIRVEKFDFVWLSSSLFSQPIDHLSVDEREYVSRIREHQREFVKSLNYGTTFGEPPIFLLLHDPDALEYIDALLDEIGKSRIVGVFCGHMHAEWSLRIYKALGHMADNPILRLLMWKSLRQWAQNNKRRKELFERYNLRIIPAPGGMMGIGGGFLVMKLYDDGSYEIEKHRL